MNTSTSSRDQLPLIALVGRPNVGKSTLFNRILGKRKAITDPTPGVTRDPVSGIWYLDEKPLLLVDTGGFKIEREGLDGQVTEKSLEVVRKADLILFIVDVEEITAEDEAFVEALRPYSEKVILVVNKVDNEKREMAVWNFHNLGFPRVMGVSAAHGRNIGELEEEIENSIDMEFHHDFIESHDIRIAILGKPNTGKSTLTNYLTDSGSSIVSDIPGTTRDVIEGAFHYRDTHFSVMDTAGIRRKRKVEENIEYYSVNRAIKSIEHSDIVFLLIDSLEGVTDQDKKIAAQIVKHGKGVILVLNKWDLLEDVPNQLQAMEDRVRFVFPILEFAPIVPLSALKGEGVDTLLDTALKIQKQLLMRVDTGKLNKRFSEWIEYLEPPRHSKGRFRVRYITQVSAAPVRFVLFINRKKGFPASYVQYLKNRIRKEFGFTSVPVDIELRERS